ncbi:GSCFA domain-containing protein [Flavobacterium crassostreae]|uniref:GSCFA domain-containing protein n=1 Tax=Flavobacterium crassostreae TaxID=1763534 RepID=A0A1B9E897_9FLAO|nr:GSCFA domain-containing protein [Flavobacterium crassostreae]OCB78098.1 GSCFA domain-containing protein [Flavobacterium crassostreae]
MQFRTQIPISKTNNPIDYTSRVVSLGSCFAVNMAEKLDYFKFQNNCNPFGILFHPLAIEKLVRFAVLDKEYTEKDVFFQNDRWHCFDAHSDLSTANKEALLRHLNTILKTTKQQLQHASHILITYGTSWVYRAIATNEIVANCHKVSQKQFCKELLTIATITQSIAATIAQIQSINPEVKFIFSVSPVRHIKDGFVENQRSKAHLISALHALDFEGLPMRYFPSYEIMMDELRDYRFYKEDMLHPSELAINYIWDRFKETHIDLSAYATIEAVATIQKALQHRPFNPTSESHQKFEANLQAKIAQMVLQYSYMKF